MSTSSKKFSAATVTPIGRKYGVQDGPYNFARLKELLSQRFPEDAKSIDVPAGRNREWLSELFKNEDAKIYCKELVTSSGMVVDARLARTLDGCISVPGLLVANANGTVRAWADLDWRLSIQDFFVSARYDLKMPTTASDEETKAAIVAYIQSGTEEANSYLKYTLLDYLTGHDGSDREYGYELILLLQDIFRQAGLTKEENLCLETIKRLQGRPYTEAVYAINFTRSPRGFEDTADAKLVALDGGKVDVSAIAKKLGALQGDLIGYTTSDAVGDAMDGVNAEQFVFFRHGSGAPQRESLEPMLTYATLVEVGKNAFALTPYLADQLRGGAIGPSLANLRICYEVNGKTQSSSVRLDKQGNLQRKHILPKADNDKYVLELVGEDRERVVVGEMTVRRAGSNPTPEDPAMSIATPFGKVQLLASEVSAHAADLDKLSARHFEQGAMGNCYAQAAAAGLSELIPEWWGEKGRFKSNGDGTYTLKGFVPVFEGDECTGTKEQDTSVSNVVALAKDGKSSFFGDIGTGQPEAEVPKFERAALVERAMVEHELRHLKGIDETSQSAFDFASIHGGWSHTILTMLTGARHRRIEMISLYDPTPHFELIDALLRAKSPVVASTTANPDVYVGTGIVANHAYTVCGIDLKTQMVRLRNPWGENLDALGRKAKKDGYLEVSFDRFATLFPTLSLLDGRDGNVWKSRLSEFGLLTEEMEAAVDRACELALAIDA